jgi:hypothetical protein
MVKVRLLLCILELNLTKMKVHKGPVFRRPLVPIRPRSEKVGPGNCLDRKALRTNAVHFTAK